MVADPAQKAAAQRFRVAAFHGARPLAEQYAVAANLAENTRPRLP